MVNIVLVSHGTFCTGVLDSLQMVGGDDFGVKAVPLFPGETAEVYRDKLRQVLKEISSSEGILVLADIRGGTPYQSALYLAKEFKLALVAGMNLPMVLTAAMERDDSTTLKELYEKALAADTAGIIGSMFEKGEKKHRAKLSINKN